MNAAAGSATAPLPFLLPPYPPPRPAPPPAPPLPLPPSQFRPHCCFNSKRIAADENKYNHNQEEEEEEEGGRGKVKGRGWPGWEEEEPPPPPTSPSVYREFKDLDGNYNPHPLRL